MCKQIETMEEAQEVINTLIKERDDYKQASEFHAAEHQKIVNDCNLLVDELQLFKDICRKWVKETPELKRVKDPAAEQV